MRVCLEICCPNTDIAVKRLIQNKISFFRCKKIAKNRIQFDVKSKDEKKVFAIFDQVCYNVKEIEGQSERFLAAEIKKRLGCVIGAVLFAVLWWLSGGLVLKVELNANAYYSEAVGRILSEYGQSRFRLYDREACLLAKTEISMLPYVEFCSIEKSGNVLLVKIVEGTGDFVADTGSLYADRRGVVTEVVFLSGKCHASVGQTVEAGTLLIEKTDELAVGKVKLQCDITFEVASFFELNEREVLLRASLFWEGKLLKSEVQSQRMGDLYRYKAKIIYERTLSINLS